MKLPMQLIVWAMTRPKTRHPKNPLSHENPIWIQQFTQQKIVVGRCPYKRKSENPPTEFRAETIRV